MATSRVHQGIAKAVPVVALTRAALAPTNAARALSTPVGVECVFGAVAVHAPAEGSPALAIQRQTDTTAVGPDGEEVPALSSPSGQAGGTENVEDPDASLSGIEEGAPFGPDADGPRVEQDDGAVQAKADGPPGKPTRVSPSNALAQLGSGQALEAPLRARMESALGHDFTRVRVHADTRGGQLSRTMAAQAFTVGEHVGFAPGRYRPASAEGQRLVAHELTHVIQQRQGLGAAILGDGIGRAGDAYERDAEAAAKRLTTEALDPPRPAEPPGVSPAAAAVQLYSGSAAASYASTWAQSTNPAYGTLGSDDCTNFASQVMEAGGWQYVWGKDTCDERTSDSVWWFKRNQCKRWIRSNIHASHTWGGAENFYQFLRASGRGTIVKTASDLEVGDVLQRDHGDDVRHHTMIVTQKGSELVDGHQIIQLRLSYHTKDTLNRAFWGRGNILDETPAGWTYYGWSIQ